MLSLAEKLAAERHNFVYKYRYVSFKGWKILMLN